MNKNIKDKLIGLDYGLDNEGQIIIYTGKRTIDKKILSRFPKGDYYIDNDKKIIIYTGIYSH
jgi:hypothetical protein